MNLTNEGSKHFEADRYIAEDRYRSEGIRGTRHSIPCSRVACYLVDCFLPLAVMISGFRLFGFNSRDFERRIMVLNLPPFILSASAFLLLLVSMGANAEGRELEEQILISAPGVPNYVVVRPGRQTVIRTVVDNESSRLVHGRVVIWLTDYSNLQYEHQFRLQPNQRTPLFIPVYIPQQAQPGTRLEARMRVIVEEDIAVANESGADGRVFDQIYFNVVRDDTSTLILLPPQQPAAFEWEWRADTTYYSYEAVVATRLTAGLSRRMVSLYHNPLPASDAVWDGYDNVVLASDEFLEDAATVACLKNWTMRGGRLWIMLDRVDPVKVRGLIGNVFPYQIVSRLPMHTINLHTSERMQINDRDLNFEIEPDVTQVRILHQGGEVTHRVGGWPAVIWCQFGQGELLLTTIDARSMIRPRTAGRMSFGRPEGMGGNFRDRDGRSVINPSFGPEYESDFELRPWVGTLPIRLHQSRRPPSYLEDARRLADAEVGLVTVPRRTVGLGLLVFLAILAGCCAWTGYRCHWERLTWLVPLLAVSSSFPVIGAAVWQRKSVPPQLTGLQIIDGTMGTGQAYVSETLSVYQPQTGPLTLHGSLNGELIPGRRLMNDIPLHRSQRDIDQWSWSSDQWPVGVWHVESEEVSKVRLPKVTGRFGPYGLNIELKSENDNRHDRKTNDWHDPVVYFPPSGIAIPSETMDSGWLARAEDTGDGETFLRATTIDDAQLSRQNFYSAFFRSKHPYTKVSAPLLALWGPRLPTSVRAEPTLESRGQSLLFLPIELQPPLPGVFRIPGWAVQLEVDDRFGVSSSAYREGRWLNPFSQAIDVRIRFRTPRLDPSARLTEVRCHLDIQTTRRPLQIEYLGSGNPVSLVDTDGANGRMEWTWTHRDLLQELHAGTATLRFAVGRPSGAAERSPESQQPWQIHSLSLELSGEVLSSSLGEN